METVKAKIKGTNAILEGCVCDDSFFVSVDHDTFERYDLDEVELCESNPDSLTLEEAAEEYEHNRVYNEELEKYANYLDLLEEGETPKMKEPSPNENYLLDADIIESFIAGAEWQKGQMMKDGNVILAEEDFDAEKEKSIEWGYNLCKQQMLKDAVCYIAQPDITATGNILIPFIRIGYTALSRYGIKVGDKVRIVVLKAEEE